MRPPRWLALLLPFVVAGATPAAEIHVHVSADAPHRVTASGFSPEEWSRLRGLDADSLAQLLSVHIGTGEPAAEMPAIAGVHGLDAEGLQLRPLFPFVPGLRYTARLTSGHGPPLLYSFETPPLDGPPPQVVAVFPSSDLLPENTLRLYVHFSQPMEARDAQRHVRLLDDAGAEVPLAFVEIEAGLWDPRQTRLTLLFHPGRIKRGVAPGERLGPPLRAGGAYRLIVDAAFRDSAGRALGHDFEHRFRVASADRESPRPAGLRVHAPAAEGAPLVVDLPEPLDEALLHRWLWVEDAAGRDVAGALAIGEGEQRWTFLPRDGWAPGAYALLVHPALEDRAGNRFDRVFDREAAVPTTDEAAAVVPLRFDFVVRLATPSAEEPIELAEEITVTAGHSERRIQDVPLRIEVVDREEIEEKALMTPGSVAMLLGETTGLRVQTTAPSTGAANVRIQGLRGRYSLLLSDGLPLYGVDGGSLSLLQVPPLDLGQVEIVKGAASALYGPAALGGVVNLVSQRPTSKERQGLLNASTQQAADAALWLVEPPRGRWAGSLLGGFHGQERQDLDDDGWSDLPAFARGLVRPRVLWDDDSGRSVFATVGGMAENRRGGTEPGALAPDGLPFAQDLDSRQADTGLVGRFAVAHGLLLSVRGCFAHRREDRTLGSELERGRRTTAFAETVLGGSAGSHTWLLGVALQSDAYANQDLPRFDYGYLTPGFFAQDEMRFGDRVALGVSARFDHHERYGGFVSPRASLLGRPAKGLTARLSAGTGFFAPTPFLEQNDESGLTRLLPLAGLVAERAASASFDLGYVRGRFEINATLFGSRVGDALQRRPFAPQQFAIVNASLPVRTWGTELLARYRRGGLMLIATHSLTDSSEEDPEAPGARREVPLTPRHVASLNAIWEDEARGRIGIEIYYTGRQSTDENPYRAQGRAYVLFGALAEKRLGRVRVFLNLENLGNVRQTRFDPLLLPARAADGRWTVDAWAPLDGFVGNGGLRLAF